MATDAVEQPITNINLKLIQAFLLVAEHSSFREAAEATGRSQSAISAQIRQLEGQIGVELFRRTTRRVSVTPEGSELLDYVRRSMKELRQGLSQIEAAAAARRRRISFACSPLIAAAFGPDILSTFSRRYPNIDVFICEVGSDGLLDSVLKGKSTFAIGEAVDASGLEVDTFLQDPVYALIPRALWRNERSTITFKELAQVPLVLLKSSTPMRTLIEEAMRGCDMMIETRYEFTNSQTLIRMAEAGLGAAVLPTYALPEVLKPSVRALRIIEPEVVRRISTITLRGQTLNPPAAFLAQIAKDHIVGRSLVAQDAKVRAPAPAAS